MKKDRITQKPFSLFVRVASGIIIGTLAAIFACPFVAALTVGFQITSMIIIGGVLGLTVLVGTSFFLRRKLRKLGFVCMMLVILVLSISCLDPGAADFSLDIFGGAWNSDLRNVALMSIYSGCDAYEAFYDSFDDLSQDFFSDAERNPHIIRGRRRCWELSRCFSGNIDYSASCLQRIMASCVKLSSSGRSRTFTGRDFLGLWTLKLDTEHGLQLLRRISNSDDQALVAGIILATDGGDAFLAVGEHLDKETSLKLSKLVPSFYYCNGFNDPAYEEREWKNMDWQCSINPWPSIQQINMLVERGLGSPWARSLVLHMAGDIDVSHLPEVCDTCEKFKICFIEGLCARSPGGGYAGLHARSPGGGYHNAEGLVPFLRHESPDVRGTASLLLSEAMRTTEVKQRIIERAKMERRSGPASRRNDCLIGVIVSDVNRRSSNKPLVYRLSREAVRRLPVYDMDEQRIMSLNNHLRRSFRELGSSSSSGAPEIDDFYRKLDADPMGTAFNLMFDRGDNSELDRLNAAGQKAMDEIFRER